MENTQQLLDSIAATHLGKKGGEGYSDQYDPTLLVAIPRYLNRVAYNLEEGNLPFVGVDTWNAFEVSALTRKGLPVMGQLKIVYDAASELHVESKSLKLYLNSFNMTPMGYSAIECIRQIESVVSRDLTKLLKTEVSVKFFRESDETVPETVLPGYTNIEDLIDLDDIEFTAYKSDASQLVLSKSREIKVSLDFLRSNCRVTNQPDFGTLYIYMEAPSVPTAESLARYTVSHRQVNHFHEEIAEMVYAHLWERFKPSKLAVTCLYSRRGGIEINPSRVSSVDLLPEVLSDVNRLMQKTLKQ